MGLITDEFIRDLIASGEATAKEVQHWKDMKWYVPGKTEYFIDCNDFGGKTMSDEAKMGFGKQVIDIMMIEVNQSKSEYRKWKRDMKKKHV